MYRSELKTCVHCSASQLRVEYYNYSVPAKLTHARKLIVGFLGGAARALSYSCTEGWPGRTAWLAVYGGVFVSVLETSVLPRHFPFAAAKGNCRGKTRADISGTLAAAKIAAGPRSIVSLFLVICRGKKSGK